MDGRIFYISWKTLRTVKSAKISPPINYCGGPEVQLFSTSHNFFLQSATFFYKSQLFSINRNFFLHIATIFYKSQLFSTNRNYFIHSCNFVLQIATIFYILATFFYNIATFFYKPLLFFTIHNFFLQITTFKIATFFHRRNKRVFSLDKREKRYFISLPHVLRVWQVDCFG